jgi:iron complex transport system ATP-binding protein
MSKVSDTTNPTQRLTANHITVGYNDAAILNQVDFPVPDGQVTVLVGPNGSGNSTLLKALARILMPRQGQVL